MLLNVYIGERKTGGGKEREGKRKGKRRGKEKEGGRGREKEGRGGEKEEEKGKEKKAHVRTPSLAARYVYN